jgi:hypothetical protein
VAERHQPTLRHGGYAQSNVPKLPRIATHPRLREAIELKALRIIPSNDSHHSISSISSGEVRSAPTRQPVRSVKQGSYEPKLPTIATHPGLRQAKELQALRKLPSHDSYDSISSISSDEARSVLSIEQGSCELKLPTTATHPGLRQAEELQALQRIPSYKSYDSIPSISLGEIRSIPIRHSVQSLEQRSRELKDPFRELKRFWSRSVVLLVPQSQLQDHCGEFASVPLL